MCTRRVQRSISPGTATSTTAATPGTAGRRLWRPAATAADRWFLGHGGQGGYGGTAVTVNVPIAKGGEANNTPIAANVQLQKTKADGSGDSDGGAAAGGHAGSANVNGATANRADRRWNRWRGRRWPRQVAQFPVPPARVVRAPTAWSAAGRLLRLAGLVPASAPVVRAVLTVRTSLSMRTWRLLSGPVTEFGSDTNGAVTAPTVLARVSAVRPRLTAVPRMPAPWVVLVAGAVLRPVALARAALAAAVVVRRGVATTAQFSGCKGLARRMVVTVVTAGPRPAGRRMRISATTVTRRSPAAERPRRSPRTPAVTVAPAATVATRCAIGVDSGANGGDGAVGGSTAERTIDNSRTATMGAVNNDISFGAARVIRASRSSRTPRASSRSTATARSRTACCRSYGSVR